MSQDPPPPTRWHLCHRDLGSVPATSPRGYEEKADNERYGVNLANIESPRSKMLPVVRTPRARDTNWHLLIAFSARLIFSSVTANQILSLDRQHRLLDNAPTVSPPFLLGPSCTIANCQPTPSSGLPLRLVSRYVKACCDWRPEWLSCWRTRNNLHCLNRGDLGVSPPSIWSCAMHKQGQGAKHIPSSISRSTKLRD